MVSEERLLVEERDEYGVIRVIESGDYRFLEFGDGVEQSCVFMPDPAWLEYDYTRAMLLGGLCHSQPRRALFLGFGAGSLTQACLRHLPLEEAEAIELRPAIPRLAREHLGLRDDPRLRFSRGSRTGSSTTLGNARESGLRHGRAARRSAASDRCNSGNPSSGRLCYAAVLLPERLAIAGEAAGGGEW